MTPIFTASAPCAGTAKAAAKTAATIQQAFFI
jgi:hypothetical protein